ncbi:poly-beta-1,6 N-acetyl-D-glucosamine export porin PgaA [Paraburkholderia sp. SARCC-3016]|uniref:poly-beta-1,6 N-acetyl-D-glucosamine export porin PgaA n=1 Tax=Paraburkholderia sp. SARCC-3016 TaxID=3058611 RepID=UPI0028072884|nr:poly-beta-1,6 N-acetyl-D-glucosamine export porin PgaA [Paraburkholderia sp. SARCC-3016]MDQ7978645.1 poly-beta-1,6 N-acetyl-D-glucosamine export porin PgaA [Paraburkholderia sp. SARCC-3016]
MKNRRSSRRMRAAVKATALLLALLARDYCAAQPSAAADSPGNVAEGQIMTERDQIRRQVFELADGGSPQVALEQARKRPDAFSRKDLLQIESLVVVTEVHWGRQQAIASDDPDRLSQMKSALAHIDDMLARIPEGDEYAEVRRAVLAERVGALQGVGRMKEATALYEQLTISKEPLPARTYAAAGDAYTYLDKPRRAAPAYERALQTPVDPLTPSVEPHVLKRIDVQEGLFFAYLDSGRYDNAQQLLKQISASTPIRADLSEHPEDVNEDYGRVKKLQAQYLLYTDRTREGVEALDTLRHEAPFDPALISARSDASLIQQRPREAERLYAGTLVDHPGDIETLAGLGETALQLNQYDRAAEVNATFADQFPDNNTVRKFQRDYEAYKSPQLIVAANGQKGNSVIADNDWGVDTQLYSQPIAKYWRVFAHQFSGRADTGDGDSVSRVRNGIGADFRLNGIDAAAEVDHSTGGNSYTGAAGTFGYALDDHWHFQAGFDTNSNGLPWKAYQAGITGRTLGASARYSVDDRRYFDLAYGVGRYSDTNLNQQWAAIWYERFLNTPSHQISTWVEFNTSSNTVTNTVYFSPPREYTAQVTAMYQWTPWRNADKSFAQRVYATFGGYRQSNVGDSALWEVRLEQAWQLGTQATLAYGIGVASQRMDRTRETSKLIYLNLNIPL